MTGTYVSLQNACERLALLGARVTKVHSACRIACPIAVLPTGIDQVGRIATDWRRAKSRRRIMWQGCNDDQSSFPKNDNNKRHKTQLTSIRPTGTNGLIGKAHIEWHLLPVIIELFTRLPLGDLESIAVLVVEPGKPATHRHAVLDVRIAESLDLGLVLDRLLLLNKAGEDNVARGADDERDGVGRVGADDDLAIAPLLVPEVGPHVRVRP